MSTASRTASMTRFRTTSVSGIFQSVQKNSPSDSLKVCVSTSTCKMICSHLLIVVVATQRRVALISPFIYIFLLFFFLNNYLRNWYYLLIVEYLFFMITFIYFRFIFSLFFFSFSHFYPKKVRSTSQCSENQIPCRSGECIPAEARCNGRQECADGSDEVGCVGGTHVFFLSYFFIFLLFQIDRWRFNINFFYWIIHMYYF